MEFRQIFLEKITPELGLKEQIQIRLLSRNILSPRAKFKTVVPKQSMFKNYLES